jgi:hypothetical protein
VEAYECWLRARALLTRGTQESVIQARAMYRQAIELDLNFAALAAGHGLVHVRDVNAFISKVMVFDKRP